MDKLFSKKMAKAKGAVDYSYHRSINYLKKLITELPVSRERSIAMQCVDILDENERLRETVAAYEEEYQWQHLTPEERKVRQRHYNFATTRMMVEISKSYVQYGASQRNKDFAVMDGRPDVLPALKKHLSLMQRGADHAALKIAISEIERINPNKDSGNG